MFGEPQWSKCEGERSDGRRDMRAMVEGLQVATPQNREEFYQSLTALGATSYFGESACEVIGKRV
jgi:hypothetical protein